MATHKDISTFGIRDVTSLAVLNDRPPPWDFSELGFDVPSADPARPGPGFNMEFNI